MTGLAPLQDLIDVIGDACLLVDEDIRVASANALARELYGSEIVGRELTSLCPDAATADALIAQIASCNGSACSFSATTCRHDGSAFVGEFSAKSCQSVAQGFALLVVRELREALDKCAQNLELHSMLLDEASDGIVAHTLDGHLIHANRAALEQWGSDIETIRERGPFGWTASETRDAVPGIMATLVEDGETRFESESHRVDGTELRVEIHSRLIDGPLGRMVVSSVRDITSRLQTEEMVRYLAYHDTLTGLANRVMLEQELHSAVAHARRHDDALGVVFIDLDDFKPVNDTYGHTLGDHVLREVADRIAGCVRDTDTVSRLGGDEFVVVLPRMNEPESIVAIGRKIADRVAESIMVGDLTLSVSASVGMAVFEHGDDAETLLTRADLQMYEARELGLAGWDLFPAGELRS